MGRVTPEEVWARLDGLASWLKGHGGDSFFAADVDAVRSELTRLHGEVADAARVIHDLRGENETRAVARARSEMLGEVVRLLRRPTGVTMAEILALGTAAPPRPPDVLREENERLRAALRGLAEAAEVETGERLSNHDYAALWDAITAARVALGETT